MLFKNATHSHKMSTFSNDNSVGLLLTVIYCCIYQLRGANSAWVTLLKGEGELKVWKEGKMSKKRVPPSLEKKKQEKYVEFVKRGLK